VTLAAACTRPAHGRPYAPAKTPTSAVLIATVLLTTSGCSTSPLGRSQLTMMPDADMARLGATAYEDIRSNETTSQDAVRAAYVLCVTNALLEQAPTAPSDQAWEVTLFDDDQANAFALPGAKIGIYSGLLEVARNQDQLAAVIGHEIGHVIARHANERVSTAYATQLGLTAVAASGVLSGDLMGLMGVGAQVGVLFPFSRTQERESDLIGLELMAKAGFDPRQSVELWENMSAARTSQAPPEFLSTHPADYSRIAALRERMPEALELYDQARLAGRRPHCDLPS
jgi:predicted Zn-dependent protease